MKKIVKDNSKETQQEKMIEKALRTGGFIFPETVEEVKEFERIYGKTDVMMPTELQEPDFLYSQKKKIGKIKMVTLHSENLAMAAREGSNHMPDEIKFRMAEDRKKVDLKRKK
jgi:hypothetical protein